MRIGIDATALYGRYGGVEYALWNLLNALSREDQTNQYCVYIPGDGPPQRLLKSFPSRWRWVRLPFRGTQKLRRIFWQQQILPAQLARDKCDALHSPTYVCPLRARLPIVLTVYDVIALSHPQFATSLNRAHFRFLLPQSIARAERIIAPSQAVEDEIQTRFPQTKARTHTIPLGLEPIFFHEGSTPSGQEVRARYDLPDKYLLYVGNFEPKKNLENLLRALELIPDAPPLVIAGGMRAWPEYDIQNTPRTRLLGYVARRDLPAIYAGCRAFVFPSLAEGFGLPVLEALACGAAVVTSREVPLPNLQEVASFCDPCDPNSIATRIEETLADSKCEEKINSRRDEKINSRREYARPFTWQNAACKTLEIYQEIG